MSSSPVETVDLLDLKLLPAWVKESSDTKSYAHYEGDEHEQRPRGRDRSPHHGRDRNKQRRTPNKRQSGPVPNAFGTRTRPGASSDQRPTFKADIANRPRQRLNREGRDQRPGGGQDGGKERERPPLEVAVRFLPHPTAFENVAAQIKSGSVAYSLFSIARLFLEKPERYDVRLTGKPEALLYQLGEDGAVSANREFLETNAFRLTKEDFYKIDITQSDPIKGNFSTVARCLLSGTLFGPPNHHAYQPRLRALYEQRFSRRMSFADYQRQIEMVNDPAVVEQWKEDARKVTTFTTLREETPSTFSNATEAERHFRQNYLPGLARNTEAVTIDGVTSRQLPDRGLHRLIENAWSVETRSPSNMMQELSKQFRDGGLHIFRHRRGMLFVSPLRVRAFAHEGVALSPTVSAILETLGSSPGINRKELAEKLLVDLMGEAAETRKLALASDLHWLIGEGYVIEFNDGSLDLPRVKRPQVTGVNKKSDVAGEPEAVMAVVPTAEPLQQATAESEIGGS